MTANAWSSVSFTSVFEGGLRVTKEFIPRPDKYEMGLKVTFKNEGTLARWSQYNIIAAGRVAGSSEGDGFTRIPKQAELDLDPKRFAQVVIMQRLHQKDLVGYLEEKEKNQGWTIVSRLIDSPYQRFRNIQLGRALSSRSMVMN